MDEYLKKLMQEIKYIWFLSSEHPVTDINLDILILYH